ncbi:MAG: Regulator of ribonuclease activity B [Bacteroidia bacterium]|nr:Regulator of ribonuclease activity B [Bacteroidia bacterium]
MSAEFFTTEALRTLRSTKFSVYLRLSVPLWLFFFTASAQTQDWDFYFTNIDDKPASIGLNLALHDTAPLADKKQCFWIILKFQQSDSLSFPVEKENETLNKLEDELEIFLQKKSQTIYAGRTTGNAERYFYFYSKSLDSVDVFIEEFFKSFPQYKYKLGQRWDEKWEVYFGFLYPSPLDLQLIYNKRIVEALAENGDNSGLPHHIDHWVNFEKKKDVADFINALKGKNFIVEKNETDKTHKSHPYTLQISEENRTDLETIDNSVLQLFELAEKFNGIYGGWETFVVTE